MTEASTLVELLLATVLVSFGQQGIDVQSHSWLRAFGYHPFFYFCFQGVYIVPCSISKAGGRDRRHDGGSPSHTVYCSCHLSNRLDLIHASTRGPQRK